MSKRSEKAKKRPEKSQKMRSYDSAIVKIKAEKKSLGSIKTVVTALLILLQTVILITLYFELAQIFKWYLVLSLVLSILCCLYTLASERSPSSKAVWIFIILFFFYVGYILFILSDEKFFFRKSKRRYKKVFARAKQFVTDTGDAACADPRGRQDCAFLKNAGGFNAYRGTDMKYFPSGTQFFDDVLEKLEEAQDFVFLEFFIISDGKLFERFFDVLSRKAQSGVNVCVIYDDMGSHRTLSLKSKLRMKKCGIHLMSFNRLIPVIDVGLNYRDHRKIVVIDGKVAYTGGANLADEYTNDKRMYGYWKDEGVRICGAAVDGLTLIFLRQWEFLTRKEADYARYFNRAEATANEATCVPFASGPDMNSPIGKDLYLNVIAKAQERLYIMTPYLVPDDAVSDVLANKAQSGVDVRIILPDVPDKAVVYKVTLNNAKRLAERGVKICLMKDSFVHSKVVLSDYCAVIGSINIDMRSFYQQSESALYTDDKEVMAQVAADFEGAFRECRSLEERGNATMGRALAGILNIISPLM